MIYVGIDVAKEKHDCFIISDEGEVIYEPFVIENNRHGFDTLYQRITINNTDLKEIKIGLESTGHYGFNLITFLVKKGLKTYVINPLHTTLFRKSMSLRNTKTDPIDTRSIAALLMSGVNLREYKLKSIETEELKSLSRYRYEKVRERSKLKVSVARLVNILFPELEKVISIQNKSIYRLLINYPSAKHIAETELEKIENLLLKASRGHYKKEISRNIHNKAKESIGTAITAKSLELKHTLKLILEYDKEIKEIEKEIKKIMDGINSPILSIPGISYTIAAMILGEIGDFERFSSPDKILAYAGISPTIYQSGNIKIGTYSHMEKRGSKYLRYALFNGARFVCSWDDTFKAYKKKKMAEGKHYKVAISHASKKLVRVMYHLEKTGELYKKQE